ncbi:MAG: hypothetical protein IPK70_16050 [Flavobacteriales bacterium]|jgi:hypothetical protein|nr:hypothetical protein [Flavobacteriales bacterium]
MKKGTHEKSISELEGWNWKDPVPSADDSSGTVLRFYRLHRTPIKDLEIGDLRFLIGQNSALEYLVPMAFDQLRKDPFVEAEYYPGDLLCALFQINNEPNYWRSHPDQREVLVSLYEQRKGRMPTDEMSFDIMKEVKREYERFIAHRG